MLQIFERVPSELSDRSSAFSDTSSEISDAMRIVHLAAEPRPPADSAKAAIGRAARNLGWSYTRTRDVWYGDARRITVAEMDQLRALEQVRDHVELSRERQRHAEQLAALRGRLAVRDGDFHRADIEAIDWLLNHHP